MNDLDAAVSMAASSIVRATEPAALQHIAVGEIHGCAVSGDGFIVWVTGVTPDVLVVMPSSMYSAFLTQARAAGAVAMIGRRVVVHFASNQALIADTIGV